MNALICEAIRLRHRLAFTYGGHQRVVEPYCHGRDAEGHEKLRAVQVAGGSSNRGSATPSGKLWFVDRASGLRVLEEPFVPDDPRYQPDDSALSWICCRV
jgi:hypothetical protein